MKRLFPALRAIGLLLTVQILAGEAPEGLSAELKPATLEGFSRYVRETEARITKELARPGAFLYVDGLPAPRRAPALAALMRGEVFLARLETRDAAGMEIEAPGGMIHHWTGAVFIPGATLAQALELVQDYNHHQDYFQPEVVRSRLISRSGDDFKVFYRLRKHEVITVTLNTDHTVHYTRLDATRAHSRSTTTRIVEVENADKPGEREKPEGHDGGFLWKMNSWWRFEERGGGVYVESESVSLTRDIPTGLGWLIKPFITGVPRESLQSTLNSTRSAVLARAAAAKQKK